MDPTENLKCQLQLTQQIVETIDSSEDIDGDIQALHKTARRANELVNLVNSLHKWISQGGVLPDQWRK